MHYRSQSNLFVKDITKTSQRQIHDFMLSGLAELGCSDTQADDDDDGYLKRNALGPEFDHIHNKCDKGTLPSSLVVYIRHDYNHTSYY